MDESKLRYFCSVVRHQSFAKAAQEYHVVPSTVSRQMAALEEELGTPLFYRDPHKVELTAAGKRLYEASNGYMRQFRFINDNVHNLMSQQENRLMIGGGPYEFALISALGAQYLDIDPDVELYQVHNAYSFIAQTMHRHDAHLQLAIRPVADLLPEYQSISLGIHRYAAVTHKDSPFWSLPPEEQAVLKGQKVVRSSDKDFDPARLWLEETPLEISGYAPGSSFITACSQAMMGRIVLFPEFLRPWLPQGLRMEQVFPDPPRAESVLLFNRDRATPLEIKFFEFVRDLYQ